MSLGEQKEQKGRGRKRAVAATQTGWDRGGTEVCWAVGFSFETKENKKGRSGQVTRRPMTPSRGFSQCPSPLSAGGEHSLQGVLQKRFVIDRGVLFLFLLPFPGISPWLWHFPAPLVSCSRSTLAPSPHHAQSGTGGATGFEARRGNTGIPPAGGCWEGTGCPFEVHTASRWAGESFGAGTCRGCLRFGATCGWPRCPGGA